MARAPATRRSPSAPDDRPEAERTSAAIESVMDRAPAALRAFFRVAEAWGLSADEQRTLLGRPAKTTFYRWRQGEAGGVTLDLVERLSHLLAIYGALHGMYLEHERADQWVRRPNDAPLFGGRPPAARLLEGRVADLYEVRRYVEGITEPTF